MSTETQSTSYLAKLSCIWGRLSNSLPGQLKIQPHIYLALLLTLLVACWWITTFKSTIDNSVTPNSGAISLSTDNFGANDLSANTTEAARFGQHTPKESKLHDTQPPGAQNVHNIEPNAHAENEQQTPSAPGIDNFTAEYPIDSQDADAFHAAAAEKIASLKSGATSSPQRISIGNGLFHNTNNSELLFGAKTLQNIKLKNCIGYGDIALYDSTVTGTVTIYGDMQTNNVRVQDTVIYGSAQLHDTDIKNKLSIYGEASLTNSKVNGNSTIFGTVNSNNSVFKGNITAATSKFTLLDTQTKGIVIQNFNDRNKKGNNERQLIRIMGKSIVNGDIIFETGQGIIELGSQAKITGKIHGGMLKKSGKS